MSIAISAMLRLYARFSQALFLRCVAVGDERKFAVLTRREVEVVIQAHNAGKRLSPAARSRSSLPIREAARVYKRSDDFTGKAYPRGVDGAGTSSI
jgi:hypothetical protein